MGCFGVFLIIAVHLLNVYIEKPLITKAKYLNINITKQVKGNDFFCLGSRTYSVHLLTTMKGVVLKAIKE